MSGRTLMIQGTSSSAGKSLLVAALCRIFARRGVRVAPFKAQNMSNNAAVCTDGSEIGRSQAMQAAAARLAPTGDMNPILLKPEADARSQVIVNGRPWQTLGARRYFQAREELWPAVTGALDRLRAQYDLVVIEGAGSPAEPNLHDVEIVNMAVARYAHSPVVLVGDIERGGVFAQLLGTLWLLGDDERALVRGMIVNKFRGDPSLFDAGVTFLEDRGGIPVLGVVPWLAGLGLPEEDAVALHAARQPRDDDNQLDIAVIRLPHIANFDDFDRLAFDSRVRLRYVDSPQRLGQPDAIILPGTKSTVADLEWLRAVGLAGPIVELAHRQVAVVGICGGYQMLGTTICDPQGIESSAGETRGLGLLPIRTHFEPIKETHQIAASIESDRHCPGCFGQSISGYEIHAGRTTGERPWLKITRRGGSAAAVLDGSVSDDGRIWGCYLHGLFANDGFRQAWLDSLEHQAGVSQLAVGDQSATAFAGNTADWLDAALDRLADGVETALDLPQLENIIRSPAGVGLCQTT
ncbi:MAG TPA: cobyric acid synthase [Pirellulales bacterium]|nr:cobyric acid synthase [Pirellulales bacterium]